MEEKQKVKVPKNIIVNAMVLAGIDPKSMTVKAFLDKARSDPKLTHLVKSVVSEYFAIKAA